MLIVEGTDNVGKTHLANAIVAELNARKYPHVYQHLSKLPDCFDRVRGYRPFMNTTTVWDRFYMSRLAYGSALKNQDVMRPEEYRVLDAWSRLVGAYTVVIVSVDENRFKKRWGCKSEMYTVDMAWRVNQFFRTITCEDEQYMRYYDLPELPTEFGYTSRGFKADVDRVVTVDHTDGDWPTSMADLIVSDYLCRVRTIEGIST